MEEVAHGHLIEQETEFSRHFSCVCGKDLLGRNSTRLEEMRLAIERERADWGSWRVNWERVVRPLVVKGAEGGVEVRDEA